MILLQLLKNGRLKTGSTCRHGLFTFGHTHIMNLSHAQYSQAYDLVNLTDSLVNCAYEKHELYGGFALINYIVAMIC